MNKGLKETKEFHEAFGHPVARDISIPDKNDVMFRLKLIYEELSELAEANGLTKEFINITEQENSRKNKQNKTLSETDIINGSMDALCDIQVVLNGTVLTFGMHNKFDWALSQVQKSNMSKLCKSKEDAIISANSYKDKGIACFIEETPIKGMYGVYRLSDEKILKGPNYTPPFFGINNIKSNN